MLQDTLEYNIFSSEPGVDSSDKRVCEFNGSDRPSISATIAATNQAGADHALAFTFHRIPKTWPLGYRTDGTNEDLAGFFSNWSHGLNSRSKRLHLNVMKSMTLHWKLIDASVNIKKNNSSTAINTPIMPSRSFQAGQLLSNQGCFCFCSAIDLPRGLTSNWSR